MFDTVNITVTKVSVLFTRLLKNYEKDKYFRKRQFLKELGMILEKQLITVRQTDGLSMYITQNIRLILEYAEYHILKRNEEEHNEAASKRIW